MPVECEGRFVGPEAHDLEADAVDEAEAGFRRRSHSTHGAPVDFLVHPDDADERKKAVQQQGKKSIAQPPLNHCRGFHDGIVVGLQFGVGIDQSGPISGQRPDDASRTRRVGPSRADVSTKTFIFLEDRRRLPGKRRGSPRCLQGQNGRRRRQPRHAVLAFPGPESRRRGANGRRRAGSIRPSNRPSPRRGFSGRPPARPSAGFGFGSCGAFSPSLS